jgi:hypothetical protein
MKVRRVVCVGYKGHECGAVVRATSPNQVRCVSCRKQADKINLARLNRKYSRTHRRLRRASCSKYYRRHRAVRISYVRDWRQRNSEYTSVANHFRYSTTDSNYQGMPFFADWNPDKGGKLMTGAKWIVSNLGKRPKGSTLHIIDHEKGFVPGNLEWTHPRRQANQQMFKIIAQQKHRIKELEQQLALLKAT